ncbi:pimeloyl-ACP methyl ester carboxylesterase [Kribbella amoyensis]|uniref:Pimeloyl-ACP methyl ester carboxylesterase n=1 Tax=Kribbella amoyensis TaxID=996641 RepID=A0A561B0V3_9ACTN|nr:alpha/beta hydrolase [Kribbella amoyensis]TWD72493.1 pimeloyl-ACP methyl ester carboxylesterase [Kribbella amoyensis]
MANFVLVPGAWLGAWAWDEVAGLLRADGHGVYAVTLSGLADRFGPGAEEVGQAQHVADIVAVVEDNDLHDVVLAGHSYAGIPAGQAAAAIGERLRRMVYVDANVPIDGCSFADGWSEEGRAWLTDQLARAGGYWPPLTAEDYAGQDLTEPMITRIVDLSTPHPGRAIQEPARLPRPITELPTTYLKCLRDGATPTSTVLTHLKSPQWTLAELDTGHWPMISRPTELAKLLSALG